MDDVMRLRLHAKFRVDRNPFHREERHSLSLYGRAVAATGACQTAIAAARTTAILAFLHVGDTPRITARITARRERRHMTEPCDLTAVEARRLIGAKRLAPTELLASCIERIEAVDHAVNAIPARDFERARTAAQRADAAVARGEDLPALHGLPIGIKDLQETAGLVTTHGSVLFKDFVPTEDMSAVAAVRRAGAIIVGKTNTPEFGAGANTRNAVYGVTSNPFDPTKSCAGSSGGSAVALATGMVPICTGSDTGGSLRNPAAFNGIVGFRPSPGLVPSDKRGIGWSNLPVPGPMARTVADTCLLLGSRASDDVSDPLAYSVHCRTVRSAQEFHPPPAVDLSRLRVAVTPDFGFAPTERHIAEVFAEKTRLFRHTFARADDASPDCSGCDEAFEVLRSLGFLAAHADKVRDRPDDVGPNVRANVAEGQRYSAADVARAMTMQTQIYRRWQAFFQHYDVILTPAITISPRSWRELYPAEIDGRPTRTYFHWLALAYAVTVPGHPALSLPVGVDRLGMPFGLQIVGPRGGDALVLAVAHALETLLAGDVRMARPVPDLAMLRAAPPIREAEGFRGFD
jgi:amidase